jgi:chemotaxis protein histidine kinase CheA
MNARIEQVLQEMRLVYLEKLPQKLNTLEALVLELKQGGDHEHSYSNLYRAVHSLRGTAGTYGIPVISTICEPFENCLMAARGDGCVASDEKIAGYMSFVELLHKAQRQVAAGRESFPEIEAALAKI